MEGQEMKAVAGFTFDSEEEAKNAAMELRKIQFLESKIDYGDVKKVQAIYEKAIREGIFQTAVGLYYLKGMRDFLVREDERNEQVLPCIPGSMALAQTEGARQEKMAGQAEGTAAEGNTVTAKKFTESRGAAKTNTARKRQEQKRQEEEAGRKNTLGISILLNFVLAAAVIAMFWIALSSDQPNILNYETAIRNRYASWEQELTQREQDIRKKELELFREE